MANFGTSFVQGLQGGLQIGNNFQQMQLRQQAAVQQQQLHQYQQAGEAIKQFSSVINDAPDEQVPYLTKMFLSQVEQINGRPLNKDVMAMVLKNPRQVGSVLMDTYNNQGGKVSLEDIGNALGDPRTFVGVMDAFNKRNRAKQSNTDFQAGLGYTEGKAATPVDYSLQGSSEAPADGQAPSQVPTPSPNDLRGMQAQLLNINKAIATVGGQPDAPGFKERLNVLQQRAGDIEKNLQFAINNATTMAANELGVQDITKASPAILQIINQRVNEKLGLAKQAEATGTSMGGLVNPDVAARTGISPLSTVAEARGAVRQGAPAGVEAGGQSGMPTLPNPERIEDLKVVRENEKRNMAEVADAVKAANSQNTNLDALAALAPHFEAGRYADVKLQTQRIAKALGVDIANVAPAQVAKMLTGTISLDAQVAMKGNTSDSDRNWLISINPNIETDPKALQMMIDIKRTVNERVISRSIFDRKYYATCGVAGDKCPNVSREQAWQTFVDAHPLQSRFEAIMSKHGYSKPAPAAPVGNVGVTGTFEAPAPSRQPLTRLPTDTGGGAALVPPSSGFRPRRY